MLERESPEIIKMEKESIINLFTKGVSEIRNTPDLEEFILSMSDKTKKYNKNFQTDLSLATSVAPIMSESIIIDGQTYTVRLAESTNLHTLIVYAEKEH